MNAFDNGLGDVRFFAQLQGLLIVGERIFVLRLLKIDCANVVEANGLLGFVAEVALDLQGFLVHFQGLVMIAMVVVIIRQVDGSVA